MNLISELKELCVGYKKSQPVLSSVNLALHEAEMIALLGANGSGKSTLIKTWTGLIPKISGNIYIRKDIKLSLVPQFKNINFSFPLKIKDVILQPRTARSFFRKQQFSRLEYELLEALEITKILNSLISECSGGQLQKVLLCRSLFSGASLIFLDEPLDALDTQSIQIALNLLKKETKLHYKTFFVITHNIDPEFISNFSKVFKIQNNKIISIK